MKLIRYDSTLSRIVGAGLQADDEHAERDQEQQKDGMAGATAGQGAANTSSSQSSTRRFRSERFIISQCSPAPSAAVNRSSCFGEDSAAKKS